MPPDWPTHRSEVAYESWSTVGGDTVHRIKRRGPGAAPPGARVAPSKPPPSPIRLTARGDLVSGDRLRLTDAKDTARAHLRDHHVPISTHEFIVRRRPRERPATAPATRAARTARARSRGSERGAGHTSRRPRVTRPRVSPRPPRPSRTPRTRRDDGTASRRTFANARGPRVRRRRAREVRQTRRRPASARSTFRRKEAPKYTDAASFHAAQRATARATGRWDASPAIRPASARPATATTRLVAGEGRGGGGLPTAAPGSATASRAARRASARAGSHFGGRTTTVLSRPVTATARGKKTVAFPDTREGRENVAAEATSAEEFGDATPTPGDGFGRRSACRWRLTRSACDRWGKV